MPHTFQYYILQEVAMLNMYVLYECHLLHLFIMDTDKGVHCGHVHMAVV